MKGVAAGLALLALVVACTSDTADLSLVPDDHDGEPTVTIELGDGAQVELVAAEVRTVSDVEVAIDPEDPDGRRMGRRCS